MYADTVLDVASEKLSDIEAMLAEDINVLADWLEGNQLVINLKKDKTESMVFGTAKRLSKEENLSLSIAIGTRVINCTRSYKYLGVLLDQSLIFKSTAAKCLQEDFRETETVPENKIIFDYTCRRNYLSVYDHSINDVL